MSIDPNSIPESVRAAMDRKPALVSPVSAGEFLRATKANPQDARNAPEGSPDGELVEKCLEIIRTEGRASVALFQRRLQLGYIRAAGLMDLLERDGFVGKGEIGFDRPILIENNAQKPEFRSQDTSSCPPETKSVESSMVTRFKCAVCGRLTVGRIPKGGNGTFRYPAQHFIGGTLCRGVLDEAEWVDVPRKSPRSRDPLPISCPPEPVRVSTRQGVPPMHVLGHPDSVCFTIPGVVMGKPRMTMRDKWAKRPCVIRYRKWMDAARAFVPKLPADPIDVSWVAYLPFPKSYSKKKREALGGRPHREKPDRDNIDKGILDFLFKNDAGISQGCMRKLWDDGCGPRLEITVI